MAKPFRIVHNSLNLSSDVKILRAAEYASFLEAEEVLQAVKVRADEILKSSEEAFELARQQGYEDGLEQGKLEHSEKIMDTLFESVAFVERLEHASVELVSKAVEKVIADMPNEERIVSIVKKGLGTIQNESAVTIKVCLTEVTYVENALSSIASTFPSMTMEVHGDKRLREGDCLLETVMGVVDCKLSTQLKAINKALTRRVGKAS
ncbi:HrpE/YscL family type III secretion apparatus protein [Halodesulfovibrio marinisediminis]|uniref:Flagellar assembly protein FliH n=1 Tax=Halodesulfovibrio marinisediminis DSM 17456 TaxID=1121457 RepID=A0A1N6I8X4_9BACT|nr:HrpE/YscL family type III secretion apparatus protein [Halodesulfovibrio marinisediminis]SIO28474.1 type III secretion protein L [Halodesulfovibrio marinisediminis DSM 17456]